MGLHEKPNLREDRSLTPVMYIFSVLFLYQRLDILIFAVHAQLLTRLHARNDEVAISQKITQAEKDDRTGTISQEQSGWFPKQIRLFNVGTYIAQRLFSHCNKHA
jgi:hypothetical protein